MVKRSEEAEKGKSKSWIAKRDGNTLAIFIHGIRSSGDTAWGTESGKTWPDLLATEPGLEALSVYNYSYLTSESSGGYSINDVVDHLKEMMKLDRLNGYANIVFIGHSMGGIIARKLLVSRASDFKRRKQRIGLFLVASPSIGSGYANWLSAIIKLAGHKQADKLKFNRDSGWLNDLDKEFRNLKEAKEKEITLFGKELSEDQPILFRKNIFVKLKPIVQTHSSSRYFGDPIKIPGSTHISIAKPESRDAFQHRLLCEFIKDHCELVSHLVAEDSPFAVEDKESDLVEVDEEEPRRGIVNLNPPSVGKHTKFSKPLDETQASPVSNFFEIEATQGFESSEVYDFFDALPVDFTGKLLETIARNESLKGFGEIMVKLLGNSTLGLPVKLILGLQKFSRLNLKTCLIVFSKFLLKYNQTSEGKAHIAETRVCLKQVVTWLLANGVAVLYRPENGGSLCINSQFYTKPELLNSPPSSEILDWNLMLSHLSDVTPNWLEERERDASQGSMELWPKGAITAEYLEVGRNPIACVEEFLVALYDKVVLYQKVDTLNNRSLSDSQRDDLEGALEMSPYLTGIHYFYFISGENSALTGFERDILAGNEDLQKKLPKFLDVLYLPRGEEKDCVLIDAGIRHLLRTIYNILGPFPDEPEIVSEPQAPAPPKTEEEPHGDIR